MLEEESGSSQDTFVLGCSYENPPMIFGGTPCESTQCEIIGFGGIGSEDYLIGIGSNQAGYGCYSLVEGFGGLPQFLQGSRSECSASHRIAGAESSMISLY